MIDALRGLSIILMLAHHFGFALLYAGFDIAFGLDVTVVLASPIIGFLSPFFAGVFILLSGMSGRFSRSNVKRGILVLVCAALLTAVGYFFGVAVWFGILHFLGLSMLVYGLLSRFLDKIPFNIAVVLWLGLFILGFITLPSKTADSNFLFWFGISSPDFSSGVDYFPFGKWFPMFMLGTHAGRLVKENKFPKWFYSFNVPFLPFVGRNTLVIYLIHQPFFYLLLTAYAAIVRS